MEEGKIIITNNIENTVLIYTSFHSIAQIVDATVWLNKIKPGMYCTKKLDKLI